MLVPMYEWIRRKLRKLFGLYDSKKYDEAFVFAARMTHLRDRCVRSVVIIMFGAECFLFCFALLFLMHFEFQFRL